MKLTKKNIEVGMTFDVHHKLDCLPFQFNNTNELEMSYFNYMEIPYKNTISVLELPKKYRSDGGGYTGDMVVFECFGEKYLSFWSDFKKCVI